MKLEWGPGPLGQPASVDWKYWCPQTPKGTWRAYYMPTFLETTLLGDDLSSLDEAKRFCEEHASQVAT